MDDRRRTKDDGVMIKAHIALAMWANNSHWVIKLVFVASPLRTQH
jgi:hypothetical protein